MIKIKCSKREKELIRRIVDLQIQSLSTIVNETCEKDLVLFCIEQEIEKERLLNCAQQNIERFLKIRESPNNLFFLDPDNLSIFRHILANLPKTKRYKKTRQKIWRKIFQHEKILTFYNPN